MVPPTCETIEISHRSDVIVAKRSAKAIAASTGFDNRTSEEIALVVTELATNILKHAQEGRIVVTPLADSKRVGIQIDSIDSGPGMSNLHDVAGDGFSSAGTLGYGLGTVDRLMDEFAAFNNDEKGPGSHIVCKRWKCIEEGVPAPCLLDIGAAARPHPHMKENGDAFVIKKNREEALVGVIDGLGHGQFAHRASCKARYYVETHAGLPMDNLFQAVQRNCRGTRGAVMALARINWMQGTLEVAGLGNVEVRLFGDSQSQRFLFRRGIIGKSTLKATITHHAWNAHHVLVLHSDGLKTHWGWEEFAHCAGKPATHIAQELLRSLAKDTDDAAVVVVKTRDEDEI